MCRFHQFFRSSDFSRERGRIRVVIPGSVSQHVTGSLCFLLDMSLVSSSLLLDSVGMRLFTNVQCISSRSIFDVSK